MISERCRNSAEKNKSTWRGANSRDRIVDILAKDGSKSCSQRMTVFAITANASWTFQIANPRSGLPLTISFLWGKVVRTNSPIACWPACFAISPKVTRCHPISATLLKSAVRWPTICDGPTPTNLRAQVAPYRVEPPQPRRPGPPLPSSARLDQAGHRIKPGVTPRR